MSLRWKLWNKMNFRNKMIVSYFLIALIPLLLFSLILSVSLITDSRQTSYQYISQAASQLSESLDVYISSAEKLMDYVILEQEQSPIQNTATSHSSELENVLQRLTEASPEIVGILVAYDDDSSVVSGMRRVSRDLFANEGWYQTAKEKNGTLSVISTVVGRNIVTNLTYSADTIFSLAKSFPATKTHEAGVVLFDIRHDIIQQMIDRREIGGEGFLYVLDADGQIVYAMANPVVLRIDEQCLEEGNAGNTVEISGATYSIAQAGSDYTGWRCVAVLPTSEYAGSTKQIALVLGETVLISILLVLVLALKTANSVNRPIAELQGLMSIAEKGDFSIRYQSEGMDEIALLGRSFNHMLEQINALVQQVYIERQCKLEAQLKSLQERIKPHFLYNTLDTISWMARDYGAEDVVELIEALTNMFRVGLSKGKDYISLRDEKFHVSNYLYIQKIRYQSKLSYEIDIPECYDKMIVPKLIIQPLVENAIYHGIKLKREGGTIRISGRQTDDAFELSVRDNGAGIAPERLALLREQLAAVGTTKNTVGFGLFYIAERIMLSYGANYGVSIDSVEGEGTVATIRLPLPDSAGGKIENV